MAEVRTPAGWQLPPDAFAKETPLYGLVLILVLAFMAGTVLLFREKPAE